MRNSLRGVFWLGLIWATSASAFKSSFDDAHTGLIIGGGTYFHLLSSTNVYDPVPGLAPSGATVASSDSTHLLPFKIGFFKEFPKHIFIELYARYMTNTRGSWTSTGTEAGVGHTNFSSYGYGIGGGFAVLNHSTFRIQTVASLEYMNQSATLSFQPTGGSTQTLKAQANSLLLGLGLRPELWLADYWVLSLFAGYQYGLPKLWSAQVPGSFMGAAQSGALTSPTTGKNISAEFGGVLIEAALKLNFF